MKIIILSAFLLLLSRTALTEIIYTEAIDGEHDEYCAALLLKILNYESDKYTLKHSPIIGSQNRDIANLERKALDVIWIATSIDYEKRIRPIRIPIYKGLLGHRIFVIMGSNQARFSEIQSLDELKNVTIGQGLGWVDTDILRANNFKVMGAVNHDQLYSMLVRNRFDAFARGLHEPWEEVNSYGDFDFVVEKKQLIIYPLPLYFFVHKDNDALAKLIAENFEKMVDDGSFDKYFYEHPKIKNALLKAKLSERNAYHLENPFLPKETPLLEKKYWYDFDAETPKKQKYK